MPLDGSAFVTALVWASLGAPPAPTAPAGPTGTPAVVAVLPLAVEGELPPRWHSEAEARLATGLSRGALRVQAVSVPTDCRQPECWTDNPEVADADFVVTADLVVGDARDYALVLDVVSAKTGKVVASTSGTCELCGFEEAVAMIEARAAVLAPEVARMGAVLPVLLFRSEPAGVLVAVDGDPHGPTPVRVTAPAGPHTVHATKEGFLSQSFDVQAVEGVSKEVELRLLPRPAPPPATSDKPGRGLTVAGAALAGVGLVGLGAGVPMLLLDGRPYRRRCEADADGTCHFDYETTVGGAVGTAIGAAALCAGITLLVVGSRRIRKAKRNVAATPTANFSFRSAPIVRF